MRPTHRVLAVLAVLASPFVASSALASTSCTAITGNLISNCGFESGLLTSSQYASGTKIPGWTSGGNLDFTGVTGAAGDGNVNDPALSPNHGTYAAFLGADTNSGAGTLSQTFSDTAGAMATLNFYLASECFSGPSCSTGPNVTANAFSYAIDGVVCTTCSYLNIAETGSGSNGTYVDYTLTFVATGSDTLSFAFTNNDDYFALDDVSVTQLAIAPEPASLLLLCTGLCGLATMVWRRPLMRRSIPCSALA